MKHSGYGALLLLGVVISVGSPGIAQRARGAIQSRSDYTVRRSPDGSEQLFRKSGSSFQQVTLLDPELDHKPRISRVTHDASGRWFALEWSVGRNRRLSLYDCRTQLLYRVSGVVSARYYVSAYGAKWSGSELSFTEDEPDAKRKEQKSVQLPAWLSDRYARVELGAQQMRAVLKFLGTKPGEILRHRWASGELMVTVNSGGQVRTLALDQEGTILRITRASRAAQPAIPYEDIGAAPGEYGAYGSWVARKPGVAYTQRSGNARVAFKVQKNERVTGVTGVVVITRAGRAAVRGPVAVGKQRARPGEQVFLLTPLGEGAYTCWYNGEIATIDLSDSFSLVEEPAFTWWVKLKNRRGQVGWCSEGFNFELAAPS